MKFKDAMVIMSEPKDSGFMVSFEWAGDGFLRSDHFPDKHAGESLIETEKVAWELAGAYAEKTYGKCVNIYVTGADFSPVGDKMIINRTIKLKDT